MVLYNPPTTCTIKSLSHTHTHTHTSQSSHITQRYDPSYQPFTSDSDGKFSYAQQPQVISTPLWLPFKYEHDP